MVGAPGAHRVHRVRDLGARRPHAGGLTLEVVEQPEAGNGAHDEQRPAPAGANEERADASPPFPREKHFWFVTSAWHLSYPTFSMAPARPARAQSAWLSSSLLHKLVHLN